MKAAGAAEAAAEMRGEGDGAEQRGAQQGEASAAQRGSTKAAEAAVAAADGGAKRGEASAAQRKPRKPPKRRPTCGAKARVLSSAALSDAMRARHVTGLCPGIVRWWLPFG